MPPGGLPGCERLVEHSSYVGGGTSRNAAPVVKGLLNGASTEAGQFRRRCRSRRTPHVKRSRSLPRSAALIGSAIADPGFAIPRISADNAFVARAEAAIYYLYIRPTYAAYRQLAIRRFGDIPAKYDVDHVHARNFAVQFGYGFVLVALVPSSINRQHGICEQRRLDVETTGDVPDACTFDRRIVDNVLGRSSRVRRG